VFTFGDVDLASSTTVSVTGTRALALLSHSDFYIDTEINVNGGGAGTLCNPIGSCVAEVGGPGGYAGGLGVQDGFGPGGGGYTTSSTDSSGAGGGFGSQGEVGGNSGTPGMGGAAYGDLLALLQGGSGGGGVRLDNSFNAGGGGGGGALEIGAEGTVTIGLNGLLEASGGTGNQVFFFSDIAAGGNGSGGGIRVHAAETAIEVLTDPNGVVLDSGEIRAIGGSAIPGLNQATGGGGRVLISGVKNSPYVIGESFTAFSQGIDVSPGEKGFGVPLLHGVITFSPLLTIVPGGHIHELGAQIIAQSASPTQPELLVIPRSFQVSPLGEVTVPSGGYTNEYEIELRGPLASITGTDPNDVLLNQGVIRGTGSVEVPVTNDSGGEINAINDTLVFTQSATNSAGAEINAIGSTLDFQGGLTNNGELRLIDSTILGTLTTSAAAIEIAADGVSEISAVVQGSGVAFNKRGAGVLVLSGANTYNGGTTIEQGTLRAGADQVIPVGRVVVQGGGTLDLTGHAETIGPGGVSQTGLELRDDAQVFAGNSLVISTLGTFINYSSGATASGASIHSGSLTLGTGGATRSFSVANNLAAVDDLSISATITNAAMNPDSATPVINKLGDGRLTLSGNNTFWRGVRVSAGSLRVKSNNALGNGVDSANTGTNVLDGASLELVGGVDVAAEHLTLAGDGVEAAGSLRSVSGINTWDGQVVLFTNATIGVDADSLTVGGVISGTGSLTKSGPGTLILDAANMHNGGMTVDEGTLGGNGSLTGILTLNTGGTLAPGASAGIFTVGEVDFNAGSVFAVELASDGGVAGTDFDQLLVTGDATLDGVLDVSLIAPFTPTPGQSFEIIDVGGTLSGIFSGLPQAALVGNFGGTDLFITYAGGDGNDVALFASAGLPGDYNGNGVVDAADYTVWRDHLGTNFDLAGNGDEMGPSGGVVDQADYLLWTASFGAVASVGSSATSDAISPTGVPEPSGLLLAASATLLLAIRRPRR
jgi:autotransporter-associated beta strand protein